MGGCWGAAASARCTRLMTRRRSSLWLSRCVMWLSACYVTDRLVIGSFSEANFIRCGDHLLAFGLLRCAPLLSCLCLLQCRECIVTSPCHINQLSSTWSESCNAGSESSCRMLLSKPSSATAFHSVMFMLGCLPQIHQLNSTWSESRKASYVRHAVREYTIHKALAHTNIVSLSDIFEVRGCATADSVGCPYMSFV